MPGRHSGDQVHKVKKNAAPSFDILRLQLAVDGINFNYARAENGATALIYASQNGHIEIVSALLAMEGIDTNHATTFGATALIQASQQGHDAEIVRALLAADGTRSLPPRPLLCNGGKSRLCVLGRHYARTAQW